jgi:hypothetical protein
MEHEDVTIVALETSSITDEYGVTFVDKLLIESSVVTNVLLDDPPLAANAF